MTDGTAARRAALDLLEEVARGATFEAARDRHLGALPDADRRLAHELAAGVLRRQRALDRQLAPLVEGRWRRIPRRLKDVLRLGAYQLAALDRVPNYAAVSTAVSIARDLGGTRSARFVNAVLRRLATAAPVGDPAERVASVRAHGAWELAHPDWLVARWVARYGEAGTAELLTWNDTPPPLVLQPLDDTPRALCEALRAAGVEADLAPFGVGVVVPRGRPAGLPGFAEGRWIVQDPAQALVLAFAAIPDGWVVFDACAAPGGKTAYLARDHVVIAGDRTRPRIARLRDTIARTRSRALPVVADAEQPPVRSVDAVLLDAPCTATGTLRRHPDARMRLTPGRLARLVERQATLLDAAASVVRPGGLLVYATCSLEPEENGEQVRRFLARHPEYRRSRTAGRMPAATLSEEGDLVLVPQRHGTDGAYAARLERAV